MTLSKLIEELRALAKHANELATELERIKRNVVAEMVGDVAWGNGAEQITPDKQLEIGRRHFSSCSKWREVDSGECKEVPCSSSSPHS